MKVCRTTHGCKRTYTHSPAWNMQSCRWLLANDHILWALARFSCTTRMVSFLCIKSSSTPTIVAEPARYMCMLRGLHPYKTSNGVNLREEWKLVLYQYSAKAKQWGQWSYCNSVSYHWVWKSLAKICLQKTVMVTNNGAGHAMQSMYFIRKIWEQLWMQLIKGGD